MLSDFKKLHSDTFGQCMSHLFLCMNNHWLVVVGTATDDIIQYCNVIWSLVAKMEHISEKVFKGVMLHAKSIITSNVRHDASVDRFLKRVKKMSNLKKTQIRHLDKIFPFFTICMCSSLPSVCHLFPFQ